VSVSFTFTFFTLTTGPERSGGWYKTLGKAVGFFYTGLEADTAPGG